MDNKNNKGCPNFSEVLENRKLRHELELDRERRKAVEKDSWVLTIVGFLFLVFLAVAVLLFITHSNMTAEAIEAYTHLVRACSALFLALGFVLLAIYSLLTWHSKHKKQKETVEGTHKKEDEKNV